MLERRFYFVFLIYFASAAGAMGVLAPGKERFVAIVHVAADADRPFCHEPLFAGLLAAHVMQDRIAMRDERVRNDLLVRRIGLGPRAREEKIVPAREQRAQIFFRLEIQAVKAAELVEQTPWDH